MRKAGIAQIFSLKGKRSRIKNIFILGVRHTHRFGWGMVESTEGRGVKAKGHRVTARDLAGFFDIAEKSKDRRKNAGCRKSGIGFSTLMPLPQFFRAGTQPQLGTNPT